MTVLPFDWDLMFPDEKCEGLPPGGLCLPTECICGAKFQIPISRADGYSMSWEDYVNQGDVFGLQNQLNLMWCPICKPPEQLTPEKREGA